MESLFHFFFGYRPVIFQQGEFRLAPSTGSYVAAAIAVAAIVATVLTYRAVAARGRVRDRVVLTVLRLGDARAGPVLPLPPDARRQGRRSAAELPRRPHRRLAQHADRGLGHASRAARSSSRRSAKDAALVKALSERFVLRTFRFSSSAGAAPVDRRADVRRRADAARRGARRCARRSWPGCRSPGWSW